MDEDYGPTTAKLPNIEESNGEHEHTGDVEASERSERRPK